MKIKLLIFATFISVITCPVSTWAQQVTAADLAKEAKKPAVEDPTKNFNGPIELLNAAKRGDASAQLDIAILYEYGFDMPDNKVYALAWYILAADSSPKAAAHRDKLMAELSPKQVERAKAMSNTLVKEMPKQPAPAPQAPPPMQQTTEPASSAPEETMPPPSEPLPMPIPDEAPNK